MRGIAKFLGALSLSIGLLSSVTGCRSNGEGATSTLSPPRRLVPRGEVIPPAGFGVDLVKQPTRTETFKGDSTVMPARSSAESSSAD